MGAETKVTTANVNWFVNENNMEYLFHGKKITNLEDIHKSIPQGMMIYKPREDDRLIKETSEHANANDVIVAEYIGLNVDGKANIKVIDALYFAKLNNPTLKMNGYCTEDDNNITISRVTRLTLANKEGNML